QKNSTSGPSFAISGTVVGPVGVNEGIFSSEIGNFFQGTSETIGSKSSSENYEGEVLNNIRTVTFDEYVDDERTQMEKGDIEEEEEKSDDFEEQDGYEDAYIEISGTTGVRLTDASRTEYQKMYESMKEELKWRLKSGRCVEDVIYEFGCLHQFE
ncbi:10109_t:CDS:2, partial [Gigaspora margarita]